jgi:hypothetical protein
MPKKKNMGVMVILDILFQYFSKHLFIYFANGKQILLLQLKPKSESSAKDQKVIWK